MNTVCALTKDVHSECRWGGHYNVGKPNVDEIHTYNLSLSPSLAQLMTQCIAENSLLLDIRLQVEW